MKTFTCSNAKYYFELYQISTHYFIKIRTFYIKILIFKNKKFQKYEKIIFFILKK